MAQVKDFGLGPDEIMVRDTARSFLAEHAAVETLRRLVARDDLPRVVVGAGDGREDECEHRRKRRDARAGQRAAPGGRTPCPLVEHVLMIGRKAADVGVAVTSSPAPLSRCLHRQ